MLGGGKLPSSHLDPGGTRSDPYDQGVTRADSLLPSED